MVRMEQKSDNISTSAKTNDASSSYNSCNVTNAKGENPRLERAATANLENAEGRSEEIAATVNEISVEEDEDVLTDSDLYPAPPFCSSSDDNSSRDDEKKNKKKPGNRHGCCFTDSLRFH